MSDTRIHKTQYRLRLLWLISQPHQPTLIHNANLFNKSENFVANLIRKIRNKSIMIKKALINFPIHQVLIK